MFLTKRECYAPLPYTLLLLDYFQAKKNCLWSKHVAFAFGISVIARFIAGKLRDSVE